MNPLKNGADKTNKNVKSPTRLSVFINPAASKSQVPTLVPPVLREVGKLAAGVASVNTLTKTNASLGSATGNPRNKVALQPGHSLMDWIRLGTSGRDLTGFGSKAGTLAITKTELSKHNKRDDAWTAIRGRVYNITEYFSFHPGGEEELMRGAGIDATTIFDEVHPWVNYEQILQKCYLGKLVSIDPSVDTEALFFGENRSPSANSNNSATNKVEVSPASGTGASAQKQPAAHFADNQPTLPRFDWIQKLDYITIIFYTKAFSNPLVEVTFPEEDQNLTVLISYEGAIFKNELAFYGKVRWPCKVNVVVETGKIELVLRKSIGAIWENYGVLRQQILPGSGITLEQAKAEYILTKKSEVNYNTWLLKFERKDKRKIVVPIGKHVRIFGSVNGTDISRSYTPVPEGVFNNSAPSNETRDHLCFIIKRYSDGKMSCFITDKNIDEQFELSKPFGPFNLTVIEKREIFILLAAGTGLTPMLGLITFLLERRIKKCQFIRLLFFNRTERDILLRSQLELLSKNDKRFKMDNILSQPAESWTGHTGHVNAQLIEQSLGEHLKDTGYTIKDIYCFVCGPSKFNELAVQELKNASISKDQVHVFEG